ncbi:MAG: hypothetical protein J7641_10890 [Cyanobacteria bacterium SID2]|nr:hypothetical protein [Cyanobacteria bacterium SID2]
MFDEDDITGTQIQGPQDLFDLRGTLLQKANPLRTKILIFSTIYRQFDFSDRDWMTLKTQDLDSLLRHLFDACPTLVELEARLRAAAAKLDSVEENLHAADLLVRCFAPYYKPPQESIEPVSDSETEEDEEEEGEDFSRLVDEEMPPPGGSEDIEDTTTDTDLEQPLPQSQPMPRLSDGLWQHLTLADTVADLVRQYSRDLTDTIAQQIADLETQLDDICIDLDPEDQVQIKHDAVRALLDASRSNLDRLGRILDRQVAAHLAHVVPSRPLSPDIQAKEFARQGKPKAIAEWLDLRFKTQGVTVLATQKARCLHIVLELTDERDPTELVASIRQSILELSLKTVDLVKIYGRKPGQKSMDWTRSFAL